MFFTTDGRFVVKLYHEPSVNKTQLLQSILRLGASLGEVEDFLAWPLGIATQLGDSAVLGVVTRAVPPPGNVPLYQIIYSPQAFALQLPQGRSWMEYLKMARSSAAAIRTIHGLGTAHGDIHFKNVLANPASGNVVLIDLDGLIVQGFPPPQVLGMSGFMAPEVLTEGALPSELTDRHSAAVLILWILLLRNVMDPLMCYSEDPEEDERLGFSTFTCFSESPRDRRNWSPEIGQPLQQGGKLSIGMLTPRLQQLACKALVDGLHAPKLRPQIREWEDALAAAYDLLSTCTACGQFFLYPYWIYPPEQRACPFCGMLMRGQRPALVELLDPRGSGLHVPSRFMALHHDMPLFADVAEPGRLPPFTRQKTPVIGHVTWDGVAGGYVLSNTSNMAWLLIAQNIAIAAGDSFVLVPGEIVSFGSGKRLARVVE